MRLCGFAGRRHLDSGAGRGGRGQVGCPLAVTDFWMLAPIVSGSKRGTYSVTIDITVQVTLM